MSILAVRKVLRAEDEWHEPDMPSKQYILDTPLRNYPYIVIRVCTGIAKDHEWTYDAQARIFAVHLTNRTGWLKSMTMEYYGNWSEFLLESCRRYYRRAVERAKNQNLPRMTLENFRQVTKHGQY